jgi:hypothetical protein
MSHLKIFLISIFFLSQSVFSEVKNDKNEDSLGEISRKLSLIEKQLSGNRIFISNASFQWKQLDHFRTELVFTAAHDPFGSTKKDTPAELHPTYLTQKLKDGWRELELSVLELGDLKNDQEWNNLKSEIEQFFKYRDEFLYRPARMMIKSGVLMERLQKVKEAASKIVKGTNVTTDVGVKILDPVVEKLSSELNLLNSSVKKLIILKTPPPAAPPTIYRRELVRELSVFGSLVFSVTAILIFSLVWLRKVLTKKEEVIPEKEVNLNTFNYYEWLRGLEFSLQNLKKNEDQLTEKFIEMRNLSHELSEARKYLNESDNQQDYYQALQGLNSVGPKIEEHFRKTNITKYSDASRKIIGQIIQLCDAIENKKEMALNEEKPQLRFVKLEQINSLKKVS